MNKKTKQVIPGLTNDKTNCLKIRFRTVVQCQDNTDYLRDVRNENYGENVASRNAFKANFAVQHIFDLCNKHTFRVNHT